MEPTQEMKLAWVGRQRQNQDLYLRIGIALCAKAAWYLKVSCPDDLSCLTDA
jgi:hypothetical protein